MRVKLEGPGNLRVPGHGRGLPFVCGASPNPLDWRHGAPLLASGILRPTLWYRHTTRRLRPRLGHSFTAWDSVLPPCPPPSSPPPHLPQGVFGRVAIAPRWQSFGQRRDGESYPPPRASFEQGGGGGRGFWTQNLVYQKWPDQIFPIVNFVFSHYGHFGLGRGGGGFGGGVPPPWFLNILKKPCPRPP